MKSIIGIGCLSICALLLSVQADAATLRVENVGIDSATCGITPSCRSISQAIANAVAGDTITVGPGRYGDLNGNGYFDDPGDERPGNGAACMICITKRVRIVSTHGASVTIIDARRPSVNDVDFIASAVWFLAEGITFGE